MEISVFQLTYQVLPSLSPLPTLYTPAPGGIFLRLSPLPSWLYPLSSVRLRWTLRWVYRIRVVLAWVQGAGRGGGGGGGMSRVSGSVLVLCGWTGVQMGAASLGPHPAVSREWVRSMLHSTLRCPLETKTKISHVAKLRPPLLPSTKLR